MTTSQLLEFTLALLLHFAPPDAHAARPWADASPEAALARYTAISGAIVDACSTSRQQRSCVALLSAISVGETALARDADEGPCVQSGKWKGRCDGGRAASVFQVHAYGRDVEGPITVARLFADRALAARITLRAARMCRHLPAGDQLFGLAGTCEPRAAQKKSARARYALWQRMLAWKAPVNP